MELCLPHPAESRAPHKLCMLWSGGKDSFLAYSMASTALGTSPSDWLFVTFVPASGEFRCHPLGLLEQQSSVLGIDHIFAVVDPVAWRDSYHQSFTSLRDLWGVERILSGDIDLPSPKDYWLARMLKDVGLEMALPLAGMDAGALFDRMAEYGIRAVVTGVADWTGCSGIVGSELSLEGLCSGGLSSNPDYDIRGEHGEYHTSVFAARGLRFASAEDVSRPLRSRIVGGVETALIRPSLLRLASPRVDLACMAVPPAGVRANVIALSSADVSTRRQ
jgi:diphthamide synthase (EF-2-diphthine--ammonia ligase)